MKLVKLVKEINRSKEDIIEYLKTIGIDKVTINTTLEAETVSKVYNHFKRDLEEQEKHVKKIVDFVKQNKVEISEATEVLQKEEEAKKKRDEEKLLKKNLEEQKKKAEEERRQQEQIAFEEHEARVKAEEEETKRRKEELERLFETQKKAKEAKKADKREKPAVKPEEKPVKKAEEKAEPAVKTEKAETSSIPVPQIVSAKDFPAGGEEIKKPVVKTEGQQKKHEEKKFKSDRPFNRDFKHGKTENKGDGKGEKPRFDRQNKGKFERVTIKDTGKPPKRPFKDKDKEKPKKPGFIKPGGMPPVSSASKDAKKPIKDNKDKKPKTESDYDRKKKKASKGPKQKEFSQKEIDEAIRETFAKIEDDSGASARSIARKKKKKERLEQEKKEAEIKEARKNILSVTEFVSTMELSNIMGVSANEIIKKCFDLGMMVSINQRLEKDLILLLAEEFGYKIEFQSEYEEDLLKDEEDAEETLKDRPPVVTVMGHVDHGKTSLLDHVRKANVVAGEAGGITQHIGAYKVRLENGKQITFLDTPGHEAFTAMRARGGQAADIVVLVVAADDSVMPQTVEAINHAQAAGVPIVIAINKVDKPEANVERIKSQLADRNILVEEWGGKYQSVEISAKKGVNIQVLLDKILLEAELLQLKANPDREARGVVLESKLDKGRGSVATILVQKGTLRIGDSFVAGVYSGKVRAMFDERDNRIEIAGPSTPVQVIGFEGLPQAGDSVIVLKSEAEVRAIALKRQQLKREQELRQVKHTTLEDITNQIKLGQSVELSIILKTDVDGSAEALADSLHKLSKPGTATVRVIHKAVGAITESDVLLAEASNAVIIGFNVRPNLNARKLAEKSNVEIRLHNIIYAAIDEVKQVLEGLLAPEVNEEITATIEVRQVFKVPKIGNIAGCYVQDGKIIRNHKVRLIRDGLEIFNGTISSLKRIKDDVREVESGYECGIGLENFSDVKVGDVIEGYKLIETKRKLESV
ncbi:MAG: translation initiation factor IF-2 [Bacteroidetes bacterium]|nr:translation initiation factor IF-2 [Bacteroidota bacterium]